MMSETSGLPADPGAIKIWFAQIYGRIDEMRAKIFSKSGWLIFETHTHGTEELVNDPTLEGVRSLCGQIDDVVKNWQQNNTATPEIVQFYYDNRIQVEQRLSDLRAEIFSRKPTFWEQVLHTIAHLLQLVQRLLPALPALLLRGLGIRVDLAQQHLQDKSDEIDNLIDGLLRR
jgi:hypothetical protein